MLAGRTRSHRIGSGGQGDWSRGRVLCVTLFFGRPFDTLRVTDCVCSFLTFVAIAAGTTLCYNVYLMVATNHTIASDLQLVFLGPFPLQAHD